MAKVFGFWLSTALILSASTLVSSSASATQVSPVKKQSTFYYATQPLSLVPFVTYEVAIANCQIIEIPGGPLFHVEVVEAVKTADSRKVIAVANSPPVEVL